MLLRGTLIFLYRCASTDTDKVSNVGIKNDLIQPICIIFKYFELPIKFVVELRYKFKNLLSNKLKLGFGENGSLFTKLRQL